MGLEWEDVLRPTRHVTQLLLEVRKPGRFFFIQIRAPIAYICCFLLHERGIDGSLVRSVVASMVVPNSSNVRPMASWKTKACYDRLCTFSTVLLMADGVNQLMNSLTYIISVSFAVWFEQHLG